MHTAFLKQECINMYIFQTIITVARVIEIEPSVNREGGGDNIIVQVCDLSRTLFINPR